MSEMKDVRLLPCPFCNAQLERGMHMSRNRDGGFSYMFCHPDVEPRCIADSVVVWSGGDSEAAWNRRSALEPAPKPAGGAQDVGELVEAARNIWPYLVWTIGPENSACHPTMPSAVAAFGNAFGFPEAAEERFARLKRSSTDA